MYFRYFAQIVGAVHLNYFISCLTVAVWNYYEVCDVLNIPQLVFTALHGMQTRSSEGNSVCPSVCLSVRLSVCLSVCQTRAL